MVSQSKFNIYPARLGVKASRGGLARINNAMSSYQYSRSYLAKAADISISVIQRFLAGKRVRMENFYSICQALNINFEEILEEFEEERENNDVLKIERSIEFPPEYWQAGTSILSYFSRVLNVKYPSQKIKVRIEQEGLNLRMEIETPTGEREKIEKTLEEYGLVITGKIQPENFISDPFEVMALKNKLEMADLELRQTKQLLAFTRDNNQQRIESLEVQVNKLHSIIEKGLQSGNHVFGVIGKMAEQDRSKYDLSNAKFGGGFATEGGFQVGGSLIDLSSASNLTDAAQQIQELLQQLEEQGISIENAKQQAASDLAKQAEANPTVMGKLVKWGQSLAYTPGKTTVSEAEKGVIEFALHKSGIPLP
jgi:transcriptional regulator with XRE-family HTH domain